MTQALYRKWRPQSWDNVIGQEHVIQTLRNAIASGRVVHAYLFAGPRGTGKTTTARLLAKAVNCLDEKPTNRPCGVCDHCRAITQGRFLDLIEIDAASNTSVEDVRDLRDRINFSPNLGKYKVYIIDEVHMLSTAAFNALLKTLEEPPSHAIFVLATTEVHKIPATVLSRCQRHEFRRIPVAEIVNTLKTIAEQEGIQVEENALTLIARQSTGAMRDAIALLDQLASSGQAINLANTQAVLGTATSQAVIKLVEALLNSQAGSGLEYIQQALDSGSDPRQFGRQIVDYLRNVLLIQMGNAREVDATAETMTEMARQAREISTPELLSWLRAFNQAASEGKQAWIPSLPLEMALVEALNARHTPQPPQQTTGEPRGVYQAAPPKPQPEPSYEEIPAPEGTSSITNQQVQEQWKRILELVKQRSLNTEALVKSCKVIGVRNNVLFIGFSTETLQRKMESNDHLELMREAVAQALGQEIEVRCYVSKAGASSLPTDVDQDGMVAAAMRDLGGEIVNIH